MLHQETTGIQVSVSAQTTEGNKATGELTLFYRWLESYSGHQVITTHIRLVPGTKGTVILDQSDEDLGCMDGMSSQCSTNRYEVGIDELISFIKARGNRID